MGNIAAAAFFQEKIMEYIEADSDEDMVFSNDLEKEDTSTPVESATEETVSESATGLELLLEIIKLIHNKQRKNSNLLFIISKSSQLILQNMLISFHIYRKVQTRSLLDC